MNRVLKFPISKPNERICEYITNEEPVYLSIGRDFIGNNIVVGKIVEYNVIACKYPEYDRYEVTISVDDENIYAMLKYLMKNTFPWQARAMFAEFKDEEGVRYYVDITPAIVP